MKTGDKSPDSRNVVAIRSLSERLHAGDHFAESTAADRWVRAGQR
jgi:hypothetical protein